MSKKLDGRVAIVTASTKGIGFAIAKRLGEEGAKIVISSRRKENVDTAVAELKSQGITAIGLVCHVADQKQRADLIDETLNKFGKIDILVNNAAVNPAYGPIFDIQESAWDKIFEVNLKAPMLLSREVAKHMAKNKKGSIITISSVGAIQPFQALGAYSISKTALLGLNKVMANEWVSLGIRSNIVLPMKRFAEADEIAGIVAFLASDDASYITGEEIIVGGGLARL